MSFTLKSRILGAHVLFAREGATVTSPSSGAVAAEFKPDPNDASWTDCGIVRDFSISQNQEEVKIFAPSPYRKRLQNVLTTKDEMMAKFTVEQYGPFMLEMVAKTLALSESSSQANPLAGSTKRGWLKFQLGSETDALVTVGDIYVYLKLSGDFQANDAAASATFECSVLQSTLNTLAFADLID